MSQNIFATETFQKWCELQGEKEYNFHCLHCAIGQYLVDKGIKLRSIGYDAWSDGPGNWHKIPAGWSHAAINEPHNFQALSERLKRLMPR